MASIVMSPARALRRPRRIDLRAILGLLLLIVAVVGSLVVWSASSPTTAVLVATHDLPAGATLLPSDLAVAHVRVDDALYGATIPAGDLTAVVGRQLASPVFAHQLLVRAQLATGSPLGRDRMAFAIPVTADTAAGGSIQAGDIVEVFVTIGKGTSNPRSTVVLPRVSVYDVGRDTSLATINTSGSAGTDSSGASGAISWLTLAVTERQALQLARARWAGQLDVALRPG
ncbi:MAG: Flp pilus assembly protein CpaB [Chloroflexi bacterium]|nr:Flp pilus assembly protein CpaB [Chloroflexota bacterium]